MESLFSTDLYWTVVGTMACLAVVVFIALQRFTAGYGMMRTGGWGPTVSNRIGWIAMEAPAFLAMLLIWVLSPREAEVAPAVMGLLFLVHYFQRTFVFPLLMRGRSLMPWAIVAMGAVFNVINAYMIGGWLFWVSPPGRYPAEWLGSPLFVMGAIVFFGGMAINLHSDRVIRHLRKPGETGHKIPRGGMYRYVTSANYFGELTEWTGFAILTWSWAGAVFALWTAANLVPRAASLHKRYSEEFGEEYRRLGRKRVIPFIF